MPDAETSPGSRSRPEHERGEDAGLGVRSPTPPTLHPTAQKILAAAKKLLTERGYQGMTLQAISAEAQVNKAGVWYYFGGKQQLVLAAARGRHRAASLSTSAPCRRRAPRSPSAST